MPYGASWHLHSETVGSLTWPCCTAIDDLLSLGLLILIPRKYGQVSFAAPLPLRRILNSPCHHKATTQLGNPAAKLDASAAIQSIGWPWLLNQSVRLTPALSVKKMTFSRTDPFPTLPRQQGGTTS
jgi:hypothetical protein